VSIVFSLRYPYVAQADLAKPNYTKPDQTRPDRTMHRIPISRQNHFVIHILARSLVVREAAQTTASGPTLTTSANAVETPEKKTTICIMPCRSEQTKGRRYKNARSLGEQCRVVLASIMSMSMMYRGGTE
jgi:hypothetical protein